MNIVFLCIENSNRSQMAEAFGHLYARPGMNVYSGGSQPSGKVNPKAIEAMQELGYDMSGHTSKGLDALPVEFDYAVTMGCGDECPNLRAKQRIDWQIPDPKHLTPQEYREVRNLIGRMVKSLVEEAAAGTGAAEQAAPDRAAK
ncbi:MAG: arsenate reductase ArsC [Pirellulaceae bacterium]